MNDLSLAKEKQQTFEVWQREEGRSLPIEMSVQVLTTGFWPQYRVRAGFPATTLSISVSRHCPHLLRANSSFACLSCITCALPLPQ